VAFRSSLRIGTANFALASRTIRYAVFAAASMGVASTASGQSPPTSPARCDSTGARRVSEYLAPLASAGELSGTVLIAEGSCIVLENSYGMADYGACIRNTPATLFAIASITKPFTDIVLDRLVEFHRLALSDSLDRWISNFPRGGEITIAELRAHRAGIPHRVTTSAQELERHSAADMVRLAAQHPLLFYPGKEVSYSSAGYSVLARVLELAGRESYAQLLHKFVLNPAGATNSIDATEGAASRITTLSYFRGPEDLIQAPRKDLSFLVGAGSIYSTPADLFKIVRAVVEGRYGVAATDSLTVHAGITWTGITNSFVAVVAYDVKTDRAIIFTMNIYSGVLPLLQRDLPRIMAGDSVPVPSIPHPRAVSLPHRVRARMEGTYAIDAHQTASMRFTTPSLAQFGEGHLIPTSDTTFFSPESYSDVIVRLNPDNTVNGLDWRYQGTSFVFRRVYAPSVDSLQKQYP
jgi:CubicO group peptidase (beta-lactamase class C family)